ncbi:AAA-like domain-containing protein [Amazonocrinis nigriterrae]|uniref:AAA-like domain-containing protein n=1 Tax=Amazonocrinis nigriterrae TaxID=2840443 RepID=UPI00298EEB7F|nr:AAA-like domain-containing protein [Amazonocrinis nigriterrae]
MEQLLEAVEKILQDRPFGYIQRFVLHQSWLGKTYGEMANGSGYRSEYIKEVGSQLWHDLSEVLGQRVTKKNLHLVLGKYHQDSTELNLHQPQEEFITEYRPEKVFLDSFLTNKMDFPNGPVPLDSPFYINRPPLEQLIFNEIMQPGCLLRIKAPRKMGKSSLLNRMIAHARKQGCQIVYLDFQEADEDIFASLDKFLRWFCVNVARQLNLVPSLDDFWDAEMGSKVSCKIYFEGYLLQYVENSPIVLALNEVNRIFEHPNIAQDFLPMLRFWHEQAKQDQTWQKLRIVVVHTTEIYIPLQLNQSPFNVGVTVSLPAFTLEQVQSLAQRYGLDWAANIEGAKRLASLQAMIGGHPYLVNLALYHLRQGKMTLEELLQTASTPTGIYSQHLRELLTLLQKEPQLMSAMQQVVSVNETVELDAIAGYKLESMGLVQLDGNQARISCELYRFYFHQQLVKQNTANAFGTSIAKKPQKYSLVNTTDILPQFINLQYFKQYLEMEWPQWQTSAVPLSLIVCEIDYFHLYSDNHGYLVANNNLQRIASTIRNCLKHQATLIAHYEQTKFAAILPQANADIAIGVAENIREMVKALAIAHANSQLDPLPTPIFSVSLGIASVKPSYENSPSMLIAAAEEALVQSKRKE